MKQKAKVPCVVFTGGGTGGHIYPGLAVADELRKLAEENGRTLTVYWIGSTGGLDKKIVKNAVTPGGLHSADRFFGIPSGKLRRYFSFKNVTDLFKIAAGCIGSFFLLVRFKPVFLFSKGGFVSVPPCLAARLLHIPVFTHECDFTPGLATRINSRFASKILVSYAETRSFFAAKYQDRITVTGNPVRPVFYQADGAKGRSFLAVPEQHEKPVLLVLGGSTGALQINTLVRESLSWLCERFIVIHQTGAGKQLPADDPVVSAYVSDGSYRPYPFIYGEMPDVIAGSDIVMSRAGANSLWECAVLGKPMLLIPLCGSGTRGDQIDNAEFFEKKHAAVVLKGRDAAAGNLRKALSSFTDRTVRASCAAAAKAAVGERRPAEIIARLLYTDLTGGTL
ncbi:MAG: UDP-N-acetylglucosamine--N-acetylmuramyl-(pentapeptide) pyrophosphoryl-undecaprenol N-acetylglucosamine transferase [Treponema sp.]|jgi:UDP-N-acetylglucosamine--N-acetylmuramyl-(pentapeptide) pyrophosphoryl-undecaprenol N-acetylglucosamine transferase|nr:UDP-N-acetylglucosamine--N-acetylmuramyl-(pentapeptide) pyrophosphoryl-undecaprenol N-acetylglucosamine transferase [Treponema sp.]